VAAVKARNPPRLVFVELKGTDVKSAAEQLKETVRKVTQALGAVSSAFSSKNNLLAVVVRAGSAPRQLGEIQRKFQKEVGIPLHILSSPADLRKILEPSRPR
jgi:diphthamide biosynthesis methyltransferase